MRDPFREGLAAGWKHVDASQLAVDLPIEADVVIVGSGAGGGVSSELLTAAGLKVVIVEEGPLRGSDDFRMREREAYPQLYQESAGRKTADKAITILQGRCVGGSTTVNWSKPAAMASIPVTSVLRNPIRSAIVGAMVDSGIMTAAPRPRAARAAIS